MPAFYIRFIVLGKIPGTNIVLSFWFMVFALMFLIALYLAISKLYIIFRLARFINPFFGAHNRFSKFDLISV